jgi:hypothetical protein
MFQLDFLRKSMHRTCCLERISVDSTLLDWVCYLPDLRTLQVGLRTGKDYEYSDVPASMYAGLLAAESKGRFFNHHIRNNFAYQPIKRGAAG